MAGLELYDWQEADVNMWADALNTGRSTSVFCAWEQSLGKTTATVELTKRIDAPIVLIVAPLNTMSSWKRAIDEQRPGTPFYNLGTKKKVDIASFGYLKKGKPGFYFIGWELMRTGAVTGQYADLVVADETHRQQNQKSDNHVMLRSIVSRYRMALSGTPAANRPDGIFATLHWLWPDRYSSYMKWVDKFWRQRRNGAVIDLVREISPGAIIADIPVFSRRLRKDHRGDLPHALPEIAIPVTLSAAQRKIYRQFEEAAAAWVGDDFIPTSIPLVQDLRLTQVTLGVPSIDEEGEVGFALDCRSSKMEELLDVLKDQPEDSTMLVFVSSARFIPSAVHQLRKKGYTAEGMSGTLTPAGSDARAAVLDGFGRDFRIMVASIAAIAEGTDGLQYKCSRQFWLSKHARNDLNQQAKWRLDRPGQTEPVQSWFTYAENTIEEGKIERLTEVQENLEEMLDNHRGTNLE